MIENTLKSFLRNAFNIPEDVLVEWAVLVESISSEESQKRPALLVGGDNLALDIFHARFVTESKVLRVSRELYEAYEVAEDDE